MIDALAHGIDLADKLALDGPDAEKVTFPAATAMAGYRLDKKKGGLTPICD